MEANRFAIEDGNLIIKDYKNYAPYKAMQFRKKYFGDTCQLTCEQQVELFERLERAEASQCKCP